MSEKPKKMGGIQTDLDRDAGEKSKGNNGGSFGGASAVARIKEVRCKKLN